MDEYKEEMDNYKVVLVDVKKENLSVIFLKEGDDKVSFPNTHVVTMLRNKDGDFDVHDSINYTTAFVSLNFLAFGRGLNASNSYSSVVQMKENTIYRFIHRKKSISFYLKEIDRENNHFEIINTKPVDAQYTDRSILEEDIEEFENVIKNREKQ